MTPEQLDPKKHAKLIKLQLATVLAELDMMVSTRKIRFIMEVLQDVQHGVEMLSKLIPEPPLPSVDRTEANRKELIARLEARDWNIARVSRELGVTRRTLYTRLATFGIERIKVPRLAKPLK